MHLEYQVVKVVWRQKEGSTARIASAGQASFDTHSVKLLDCITMELADLAVRMQKAELYAVDQVT